MQNKLHKDNKKNYGFTLVELAIVLVIIGLLVVTVAAGKTLIAGGRVRAVVKEIEEIQSAFIRYQEKYAELPGDSQNATSYFGATLCVPPITTSCNGNGDEQIVWDDTVADSVAHEGALAFSHLQLAEMLGGDPLTGQGGQPGFLTVAGTSSRNMPASKIANAGYTVDYNNFLPNVNALQLGGIAAASAALNTTPILDPKDAASIDDKLDDGLPSSGRTRGVQGTSAAGACLNGSVYDISLTQKNCIMQFQLDTEL